MKKFIILLCLSLGNIYANDYEQNNENLNIQIKIHNEYIKRIWKEREELITENLKIFENNGELLCDNRIVAKKYNWNIDKDLFVNKEGFYFYATKCIKRN